MKIVPIHAGSKYEGQTHYGWMEIANNVGTASGQVLGWAYEIRPD